MLTAIMSGGVGISGRELSTQLINSLEQANHSRASRQHGGRAHLEKSAWGQGSLGKVNIITLATPLPPPIIISLGTAPSPALCDLILHGVHPRTTDTASWKMVQQDQDYNV